LADDLTAKGRVLRANGAGGSHPERWTRAASTRPHMYHLRELHRRRLQHAGSPEIEDMPRTARAEGVPGVDRTQRTGGQDVPDSRDYGQQPPRAGVSTTGNRTPDTSPSGADGPAPWVEPSN
jgi:hypothetical protein